MKITELKEKKMSTREIKDASGQRVRTQVVVELPRKIKTISGWPRFGHYLIDFVILIGISVLLTYIGLLNPARNYFGSRGGMNFRYAFDFSGYIITFAYYAISEATMGRTIGKMVTNSYVIDEYAKKPEVGTILLRSISRIVPFEAFSCLGERGWHDQWSKTYVVSKTEWDSLKRELEKDQFSISDDILD